MFQIGDQVMYGVHGICNIVESEQRVVDHKNVEYLVLEPVGQINGRYFVPVANPKAMAKVNKILSRQELTELLSSDDVRKDSWVRDESSRKQQYRELISSADRTRLMAMVHTLYRHREEQISAGKRCHLCDENFLKDAEKLLISEISVVMEMEPEQAKVYLREHLK